VRRVVERSGLGWNDPAPFARGETLGEALITPTRIYVRPLLKAMRETKAIKALAHITGGGLTENIPRVLPASLAAEINLRSFDLPPVFRWLQAEAALDDAEMLRTFNCGVGMVIVVARTKADAVEASLREEGERPWHLGRLDLRQDQHGVRFIGSLTR
jgi:phosphoribosylformylglycinamidine cyclo-ligase